MLKILFCCLATLAVSLGQRRQSQLYFSAYVLYTKDNPKSGLKVLATPASVIPLPINKWTNCAIIVHGYHGKGSNDMNMVLRDAFLTGGKTNVIVVDWAVAASNPQIAPDAVPAIGENIAELVKHLVMFGKISKAKLHLVGFDLGAHVVGCAGRLIRDVARITGLNPVGGEQWMLSRSHLRSTDAKYVEAIHTEVSEIGLPVAVGEVDFFPNGGVRQPGCQNIECSHNRAWQLFAASLTNGPIMGYRCSSVDEALNLQGPCTGYALPLGNNDLVKLGSGVYSLSTSAVYPYSISG
ncbi:phospholipase A1 member A-like [Hyposmocoma kahamanoa]|uniref:phospholipase A1 member A-like n=1 Tax=Hyposmocoma kahamanoa TaxID=1477025 RepID=UPI000E6D6528|nr:phospholipase A1 member A-like [Hyposmocoma kahamanoa]